MSTTEHNEQWRRDGVRWGIIAGSTCVVLFAVVYFLDRSMVLSRELWLGSGLVYLFAMWQAQRKVDSFEIKKLIQPGFMAFVVANAIFYLYYHLLFAAFDQGLVELQAEMLAAGGQDGSKANVPTISKTFFSYIQSLIFGFVISAVIALGLRLTRK